jgi:hypothetical protein
VLRIWPSLHFSALFSPVSPKRVPQIFKDETSSLFNCHILICCHIASCCHLVSRNLLAALAKASCPLQLLKPLKVDWVTIEHKLNPANMLQFHYKAFSALVFNERCLGLPALRGGRARRDSPGTGSHLNQNLQSEIQLDHECSVSSTRWEGEQ